MAEFVYNNAPNAATGVSPFYANKGYNPNLSIHPEYDLASARAQQYVTDLAELHANLKNVRGLPIFPSSDPPIGLTDPRHRCIRRDPPWSKL